MAVTHYGFIFCLFIALSSIIGILLIKLSNNLPTAIKQEMGDGMLLGTILTIIISILSFFWFITHFKDC